MYIILTPEQADQVRKPSLQPRKLADGNFALTTSDADDSIHDAVRPFLMTLPQQEEVEWADEL